MDSAASCWLTSSWSSRASRDRSSSWAAISRPAMSRRCRIKSLRSRSASRRSVTSAMEQRTNSPSAVRIGLNSISSGISEPSLRRPSSMWLPRSGDAPLSHGYSRGSPDWVRSEPRGSSVSAGALTSASRGCPNSVSTWVLTITMRPVRLTISMPVVVASSARRNWSADRLRSVMSTLVPTRRRMVPFVGSHRRSAGEEPPRAAVLVQHPVLDFVDVGVAVDTGLHPGRGERQVAGMHSRSPVLRAA